MKDVVEIYFNTYFNYVIQYIYPVEKYKAVHKPNVYW